MSVDQNHNRLRTNLLKAGIVLERNADELARDLLKHMADSAKNNPNHPVWNITKTIESIGKPIIGKNKKGQKEVIRDTWGRDAVIDALKNDYFLLLSHHNASTATHTTAFYKTKNLIINRPVQNDAPADKQAASHDEMSPTDVRTKAFQDLVKLGIISVTANGISQEDRYLAGELIEKIGTKYQNVPDSSVWNLQEHFDDLLEKRLKQDPLFETDKLIEEIRANISLMVVIPKPNPRLETKRRWDAPDGVTKSVDISSYRGSAYRPSAYVAPSAAGVSSSSGRSSSLKPRKIAPLPAHILEELEAEKELGQNTGPTASVSLDTNSSTNDTTESTTPETADDPSDTIRNDTGNTNTPPTDPVNDNLKTPQQPSAEAEIPLEAFEATKDLARHIEEVFRKTAIEQTGRPRNPTMNDKHTDGYQEKSWGTTIPQLSKQYNISIAQVMYIHGYKQTLRANKKGAADDLLRRVEEANNPDLNADPSSLDVDTKDAMGTSDPSSNHDEEALDIPPITNVETADSTFMVDDIDTEDAFGGSEAVGHEEDMQPPPFMHSVVQPSTVDETPTPDETPKENIIVALPEKPGYRNGSNGSNGASHEPIENVSFEASAKPSLKVDGIIDAGRLMLASFDKARQDLMPKYSDTPSSDIVGNLTIPTVVQSFESKQVSGLTNLFGEESAAKIRTYDDFLDAVGLINEGNSFEFAASSPTPDTDSVAARSSNGNGHHLRR